MMSSIAVKLAFLTKTLFSFIGYGILVCLIVFPVFLFSLAAIEFCITTLNYFTKFKKATHLIQTERGSKDIKARIVKILKLNSSLTEEIPYYLVNAYLHTFGGKIYEYDPENERVSRTFEMYKYEDIIYINQQLRYESSVKKQKLVTDISDDLKYFNYNPTHVRKR